MGPCKKDTLTAARIVEAVGRGYYVTEDGIAHGPKGSLSVAKYGKQKYPTISTNWSGRVYGVPVHQLAAYCFYGDAAFSTGVVVRHLDGDTLNIAKSNIILGTHSQNALDKPAKVRQHTARLARAAQGYAACNRKLTPEQVAEVMEFYKTLGGKKAPNGSAAALAAHLGVSKVTLLNIKNGVNYVG